MRFERLKALAGNRKTWMVLSTILAAGVVAAGLLIGTRVPIVPGLDVPGGADKPVKGKLVLCVIEENMAKPPERLKVYRLEFPYKSKRDFEELAGKFGMSGVAEETEYPSGGTLITILDGDLELHCEPDDGKFNFVVKSKYESGSTPDNPHPTPPELPPEEELGEIAIQRMKEVGLLPPEVIVTGTGGNRVQSEKDGVPYDYWRYRIVYLSRKLDGYRVVGPGMEQRVYLWTGGELIAVFSSYREPVPVGEYRAKSIEEATAEAEEGKGAMNLHADVEDPLVNTVEILYYADPATPENKILQPVYCFSGPETCIYVPAIKQ